MANFVTNKVPGSQLTSPEWNQMEDIDNAVISSDQVPDTGDLNQTAKMAATYAAQGGVYCTDTGIADAYVLTQITPLKAPPVSTLKVGTTVSFRPGNTNGGASTANVFAHGVKSIKLKDGSTDPAAGDIPDDRDIEIRWDGTVWRLVTIAPSESSALLDIQVFTSTGTYTPNAKTKTIAAYIQGGGGGGGGAGGVGGAGGTSSLGSLGTAVGGGGGGGYNGPAGIGGAASGALINLKGSNGGATTTVTDLAGGNGGPGIFGTGSGSGGQIVNAGQAAYDGTGAGGGGAGSNGGTAAAAGGGAGGLAHTFATGITGTYAATVGTGGAGNTAGAQNGGDGGDGIIIIYEYS
jgi:hypothetical protein